MTRHQIETRTVATLRKALLHPRRRAAVVFHTTRARFYREMGKFGLTADEETRAFQQCLDLAELENLAEAA